LRWYSNDEPTEEEEEINGNLNSHYDNLPKFFKNF
jgi:hypothetical protein